MNKLREPKTEILAEIIRRRVPRKIGKLLVVGCGEGIEAAALARELDTEVVGIDAGDDFDTTAFRYCQLQKGDAKALEFYDGQFDFIYSFHVLEHIPGHMDALREMQRVLSDYGHYMIGHPQSVNVDRLSGK